MVIMASLIKSAAVPCSGVLSAARSAKLRRFACGEVISGIGRMRPKSVSVHAGLARFGERALEIFFHAAIAREIGGDEMRGFFLLDAELRCQPKRRKPVNDSEIDGLSGAAVLGVLRHGPTPKTSCAVRE